MVTPEREDVTGKIIYPQDPDACARGARDDVEEMRILRQTSARVALWLDEEVEDMHRFRAACWSRSVVSTTYHEHAARARFRSGLAGSIPVRGSRRTPG